MGIGEWAIALRLMAGQQMGNATANHHKTDRRSGGGVAGTFNHGARLGGGVAEWAHPQKQLGITLARDNQLSLSRKLPSPAITNPRYREKCPRPRCYVREDKKKLQFFGTIFGFVRRKAYFYIALDSDTEQKLISLHI